MQLSLGFFHHSQQPSYPLGSIIQRKHSLTFPNFLTQETNNGNRVIIFQYSKSSPSRGKKTVFGTAEIANPSLELCYCTFYLNISNYYVGPHYVIATWKATSLRHGSCKNSLFSYRKVWAGLRSFTSLYVLETYTKTVVSALHIPFLRHNCSYL